MSSTFTTNAGLEEPGLGDYVNSWNVPNNSNFTTIDAVLGSHSTIAFTNVSVTLSVAQAAFFQFICTGTLSGNVKLIFPATIGGRRVITNNCTGAFTLKALNGAGDAGGGVTIPQGGNTGVILTQGQAYPDASGDVSGPASSTATHVATWNSTDGTLLADSGMVLPTGIIVGTTDSQTLTNKTLTAPAISGAGTISGMAITATNASLTTPSIAGATITGSATAPTQAVGDASTLLATTRFANPSHSNTANGWAALPGGAYIQWGAFVASGSGLTNWTFPVAFPNGVFAVSGVHNLNSSYEGSIIVDFSSVTTTDVPVGLTAGPSGWIGANLLMIAIGY